MALGDESGERVEISDMYSRGCCEKKVASKVQNDCIKMKAIKNLAKHLSLPKHVSCCGLLFRFL